MSLFKARDWWSTSCGEEETFDQALLRVSALGSSGTSDDSSDVLVVGSHAGIVRVFRPTLPSASEAPAYKPTDLLIETQLQYPVLGLQVGRFISGSQQLHLAILHPRSVSVYSFVTRGGNTEHGEQNALIFVYEHQLRRSAYCLVAGPFGGVHGRDFLCVQSLDGTLSFYEQETFVFTRQLPHFLLPGPIVFVPSTDAFVTCNSHYHVESFKYQALSEAEEGNKRLVAEWSLNIGESALDISVVVHSSEVHILVLGEHNLFCIRDHGTLKYMQRFEFNPHCFCPYRTEPEDRLMTLVATDTGALLVFNHTTLRWSAQLSVTPIAIARGTFQDKRGVIVLLSENGVLQCCYLGTEPSLFVAPAVEPRPIDYREAEKELADLTRVIRAFNDSSSVLLANNAAERELAINVTSSQQPDVRGDTQVCHVTVDLVPHAALSKVQVTLAPKPPIVADPPTHTISSLCETYQVASYVSVSGDVPGAVWSLEVSVIVSYVTSSGIPRVVYSSCQLPLRLVATPCSPTKEAELKVTLNSNIPAVSLLELFPEFNGAGGGAHMIGFLIGPVVVTLLAAKMTTRYRLQSDSIVPLAIITSQLVSRLERYAARNSRSSDRQPALKVSSTSAPPLQQLFMEIENHFHWRQNVADLREELGFLSVQFRAVERRLLTKMKDKKPTPLGQLDTLLYSTQQEIISASRRFEDALQELHSAQYRTACAVHIVLLIVSMSDVSVNDAAAFRAALSPNIMDSEDQGWEDVTDAALQQLLRTTLARSKRDQNRPTPITLDPMMDISRLKKHITSAVDRILRDSHSDIKEDLDGRKTISPIHESTEGEAESPEKKASETLQKESNPQSNTEGNEEDSVVPLGSRLGEIRVASAQTGRRRIISAQNRSLPGLPSLLSSGDSGFKLKAEASIEESLISRDQETIARKEEQDEVLWI